MNAVSQVGVLVILAVSVYIAYFKTQTQDLHRVILTENVADEYDYVIIGGGSAGSVLAARLSEDKASSVLLIEAGGFYGEQPYFHIPMLGYKAFFTEYDWGYYTEKQKHSQKGMFDNKGYWPRGRVLGGTSILNSMMYTRGSPFEYDEWASNGCSGWSYNEVLPYFLKSEDIQIPELKASKYHSSGGPLPVSRGMDTSLTDVFIRAGRDMGYNYTDYNSADQIGFSKVQYNVKNGIRASSSLSYLGNETKRKNLDITVRSFATKINIQNKTAVGVFFIRDGRKYYVKARKEVIVSGGTINSPQLLMLSGIGPKHHLDELGIPVKADLPVGQNLQDHQGVLLFSKIQRTSNVVSDTLATLWTEFQYKIFGTGPKSWSGVDATAFLNIDDSQKWKTYPDIQLVFFSQIFSLNLYNYNESVAKEFLADKTNIPGFTTQISFTHPKSTGEIRLRSDDPFDPPMIDPKHLADRRDVSNFIAGIRLWEKLLETETIKKLGADINQMRMSFCSHEEFRTDAYWECFMRHLLTTFFHHSGTCKMGSENDTSAVVNPKLQVKGISSLRVVDASIFPNVTSGNTNAPVIMVAEKAADMIRGLDTAK